VTCSPTRTSPPPCPCFVEQRRSAARTVRTGSAIGDDRPRRMPLRPPRRSAGGAPSLMWIRGPRAWLSRYAGPPPTTTAAYISLRFHHPAPSETSTARNPVGVSLRHAALGAEPFVCDTRRPLRVLQGFQRVIHRRRGRHRRDIGREAGGISIRSSPARRTSGSPRIQKRSSPGRICSPTTPLARSTRSKCSGFEMIVAVNIVLRPVFTRGRVLGGRCRHPRSAATLGDRRTIVSARSRPYRSRSAASGDVLIGGTTAGPVLTSPGGSSSACRTAPRVPNPPRDDPAPRRRTSWPALTRSARRCPADAVRFATSRRRVARR